MLTGPEHLEERARRRLPHFLFDYIAGGSYDEQTLRANRDALRGVRLRQRVMRDVSGIETNTRLFGQDAALPLGLGPVGLAGMCARRGEVQAARAAEKAGVPFCLSTVAVCSVAEVAAGTGTPFWFQLYMIRDRAFMADMLQLAAQHCSALVFTVDMPVGATRYRDFRSGMSGAPGLRGMLRRGLHAAMRPGWAWDVGLRGRPHAIGNLAPVLGGRAGAQDFAGWILRNFDPSVTWDDLAFVREHWRGPLIIKGVLDPEDADAAVAAGADGIVVSNHGGRQLDGALASTEALPAIAAKVKGRATILADGGVRSGVDLLKMLALGADGVLLGRAWAYALATGGEAGVSALIDGFGRDLRAAMAMTGCRTLADITPDILARRQGTME
ncbi:L-lactate dehydrogenase [Sphingomonas sp. dw_22]|uniref:L-lactate dehydrogenase n=1 Tax=Sphingomonas sp. dw_22 TaxID=2721175 RepID=UPI001BD2A91F|nr:L-lactate dehydrogenase [Sphingomonas sp. dw_22]